MSKAKKPEHPPEAVYRIKKVVDGETMYSTGGCSPDFTNLSSAKTFRSIGLLRSHLTTMRKGSNPDIYNDCEIVQYMPVENSSFTLEEHKKLRMLDKLKGVNGATKK